MDETIKKVAKTKSTSTKKKEVDGTIKMKDIPPSPEVMEQPKYAKIRSIDEANDLLVAWSSENKEMTDFPDYVLDSLMKNESIFGNANEYHNLACEFARKSLYRHAEMVAELGVLRYKFDIDLLSDIVRFASQSQNWEQAKKAHNRLNTIDYKKWTWRAFTFVIDYLLDSMESTDVDEKAIIREVMQLISEYKKKLDERAWVAEADLHLKNGERSEAIVALKDGVEKVPVAPQCCTKLSDMLLEDGMYEEVIKYTAIGIRATAQEQPSSSNGYLFYASALAKDAMIHKEELEYSNKSSSYSDKGFKNKTAVNSALLDYQIAKQLLQGRPIYLANIMQREIILESKSGENRAEKRF